MTNNPGELEFPLDWEVRIIAFSDQLESVKEAARCCLLTVDPDSSIDVGKASGAGSYTALRAKSRIASRSQLERISGTLAALPGVKMLM